ncbi:hypothetical protein [Paraglaciecola aestuariivivens]
MKTLLIISFSLVSLLSGCTLLERANIKSDRQSANKAFCVWAKASNSESCELDSWLRFWGASEELSWSERKQKIDALGSSKADLLKKVLLSQGKTTPYQNRLRSQSWLETLLPKFSPDMRRFVLVGIYHPSQDILELQSALATAKRLNQEQSNIIQALQQQLDKQQIQIEQLLNIEASIMQNINKEK